MFFIWLAAHRWLIYGAFTVSIWLSAVAWYLRYDLRKHRNAHSPHKWSVDMVTKKGSGARTKDLA